MMMEVSWSDRQTLEMPRAPGVVVVSGDYFNSKLHTRKIHSLMKDWSDDYDDVLLVMQVHQ